MGLIGNAFRRSNLLLADGPEPLAHTNGPCQVGAATMSPRASWQHVHPLQAQGFCHVAFGVRAVPECGQAVRSLGLWHSILTRQRRFDLDPA